MRIEDVVESRSSYTRIEVWIWSSYKMIEDGMDKGFLHEGSRAVLVAGLPVGALEILLAVVRIG